MTEPDSECGLDIAFAVVGGKWKPLILYYLARGPRRFGELRRLVAGVSEKVLIQQLRELQADRVVSRTDHREVPPRVDYAITAYGLRLAEALVPLCDWGNANRKRVEKTRRVGLDPRILSFAHPTLETSADAPRSYSDDSQRPQAGCAGPASDSRGARAFPPDRQDPASRLR